MCIIALMSTTMEPTKNRYMYLLKMLMVSEAECCSRSLKRRYSYSARKIRMRKHSESSRYEIGGKLL